MASRQEPSGRNICSRTGVEHELGQQYGQGPDPIATCAHASMHDTRGPEVASSPRRISRRHDDACGRGHKVPARILRRSLARGSSHPTMTMPSCMPLAVPGGASGRGRGQSATDPCSQTEASPHPGPVRFKGDITRPSATCATGLSCSAPRWPGQPARQRIARAKALLIDMPAA